MDDLGDDDDDEEKGGKGGRQGRRKIKIEYIDDKSRRHITFSKRKAGIMKKAYELSTLTGTQVLLLVASETGHVYTFATPKLQPLITKPEGKNLIQACLNAPDPNAPPNSVVYTSNGYAQQGQQQQQGQGQQQQPYVPNSPSTQQGVQGYADEQQDQDEQQEQHEQQQQQSAEAADAAAAAAAAASAAAIYQAEKVCLF
ncbi:hypothetical protein BDZ88DRAFT_392613 [Geranomyces variabilis]|nr:hypothetical protein BDZ88DRAFT_392613 [Geranomyces variabilis]